MSWGNCLQMILWLLKVQNNCNNYVLYLTQIGKNVISQGHFHNVHIDSTQMLASNCSITKLVFQLCMIERTDYVISDYNCRRKATFYN